jgi:lipoprotein-anchoring transpeptidase ErfK/SrfK
MRWTLLFIAGTLAATSPAALLGLEADGHATVADPSYRMVPASSAAREQRVDLAVLKLNRIDLQHALEADSLVVPNGAPGLDALSPFPERVAAFAFEHRLVVVSLRVQAFAAYDSGRRVLWGPVSTGSDASPTPVGRYRINWKLPLHRSTVDPSWLMPWCMNIDNRVGTALHAYALPGHPASHCCIRLLEEDARWLYHWVDTWRLSADGRRIIAGGTPVVVFGSYDFESRPPWRRLPLDPAATRIDEDEFRELSNPAP